jgi:hypothetical protein
MTSKLVKTSKETEDGSPLPEEQITSNTMMIQHARVDYEE